MKQRMGKKSERTNGQRTARKKRHTKARAGGKRRPRVPPPESEVWPVWCRGKLWEPVFARWFAGRCQLCAYSCEPPEGRRRRDALAGLLTMLLCTNHPDTPGKLREVLRTDRCRNFQAKLWLPPRVARADPAAAAACDSDPRVRRIPLGHNRFATVDARDYKKLSRYKWCASKKDGRIYAIRRSKEGRIVYMHREIMNAPEGTVVDHIDHNTLNNRRCNLRVLKPKENYANAGPRGALSGFVGVWRQGNKWEAGIHWRGKRYYLGRYDDPVEAARVRDRKAYELHGKLAFLNFPEAIQGRRKRPSACRRRSRRA